MIDHGIVKSTVKPEEKVVDDYSVWLATDIKENTISDDDGERTEFEYHLIQYTKDEYIKLIDEKNVTLEEQLTGTQLALCDVYEMIGG
ncbi:hypothetical protein [Ruminococcus sp. YE282]|uniref:hypothetical protein n=1 Tax=Ruminococcus sp. YE282 TaxID=3158780 RepID=UPI000886C065|nr:hypothetical protein SAMN02910441_01525 [Ruminococcus bromii]